MLSLFFYIFFTFPLLHTNNPKYLSAEKQPQDSKKYVCSALLHLQAQYILDIVYLTKNNTKFKKYYFINNNYGRIYLKLSTKSQIAFPSNVILIFKIYYVFMFIFYKRNCTWKIGVAIRYLIIIFKKLNINLELYFINIIYFLPRFIERASQYCKTWIPNTKKSILIFIFNLEYVLNFSKLILNKIFGANKIDRRSFLF